MGHCFCKLYDFKTCNIMIVNRFLIFFVICKLLQFPFFTLWSAMSSGYEHYINKVNYYYYYYYIITSNSCAAPSLSIHNKTWEFNSSSVMIFNVSLKTQWRIPEIFCLIKEIRRVKFGRTLRFGRVAHLDLSKLDDSPSACHKCCCALLWINCEED